MIDRDKLQGLLLENGISIQSSTRYKNCAWRIRLSSGTAIFLYDKGGLYCQGREAEKLQLLIEPSRDAIEEPNNKVFVAYGHDKRACTQLQLMLEEHDLTPLFLDALPSSGKTIIEKLEAYIPQANYGIVLMTPDDEGCKEGNLDAPLPRARQNVILEMGMLLMRLGRSRVAIIEKSSNPEIEMPSDISGVIRFRYKNDIREIESNLLKEMKAKGY